MDHVIHLSRRADAVAAAIPLAAIDHALYADTAFPVATPAFFFKNEGIQGAVTSVSPSNLRRELQRVNSAHLPLTNSCQSDVLLTMPMSAYADGAVR